MRSPGGAAKPMRMALTSAVGPLTILTCTAITPEPARRVTRTASRRPAGSSVATSAVPSGCVETRVVALAQPVAVLKPRYPGMVRSVAPPRCGNVKPKVSAEAVAGEAPKGAGGGDGRAGPGGPQLPLPG